MRALAGVDFAFLHAAVQPETRLQLEPLHAACARHHCRPVHATSASASSPLLQVLLLFAVELIGSKVLMGRWSLPSAEEDDQPGSLSSDLLAPAKATHAARQQAEKAGKAATPKEDSDCTGIAAAAAFGAVHAAGTGLRVNSG